MLQVYDRVLVSGGLLTLAFLSAVAFVALVVMAVSRRASDAGHGAPLAASRHGARGPRDERELPGARPGR